LWCEAAGRSDDIGLNAQTTNHQPPTTNYKFRPAERSCHRSMSAARCVMQLGVVVTVVVCA
jgi:hypothetical protein